MSSVAASPSFFERGAQVFSNSDNILEGSFWGLWCLISTDQWRQAYTERSQAVSLDLEPAEKAQKTWDANKKFIVASCSFASGICMVVSWMNQVSLLTLGNFAGLIGAIGFGGGSVSSGSSLIQKLYQLDQQRVAYYEAIDPKEKTNLALDAVNTLIKVAFFASMVSWGLLGAAFSIYGGAALFVAQDTAFYYCAVTFLSLLASEIVVPIAKKLP